MEYVKLKCLGCGRLTHFTSEMAKHLPHYPGQGPITFCSRRCNLEWTRKHGEEAQERLRRIEEMTWDEDAT